MKFPFAILMISFMISGIIAIIIFTAKPASAAIANLSRPIAGAPAVDATGTAAAATIAAALAATPSTTPSVPATLTPTVTPRPTLPATPDGTATQTTKTNKRATAIAATLTAQPTAMPTATPTPNLAATATDQAGKIATAIAVTLTARARALPTSTPTPTAPPPITTPTANSNQAVVDSDSKLNVRAGPSTGFTILLQLNPGDPVTILGRLEDASWVQIQAADGRAGWVSAAYVKSSRAIYTYPVVAPPPPPIAAATSTPVACPYLVDPALASDWSQTELGCATGPSNVVWASYDPFERGFMLWRRDTDTLYLFFDSGGWQAIPDKWDGKAQPRSRGAPPPGLQAPVRGSGWIWGNNDAIFQALGWATDKQKGFCALVQTFAQGFLLRSSTVEFCHEEKLYNFAREPDFRLAFILAHNADYWRR